ncbi:MAG: glycoside hydrolase family 15 protein [Patescibacteria group bacterium]|nr:glycoside hydrolase family 15 protein [Patescibacteria group bacterium]
MVFEEITSLAGKFIKVFRGNTDKELDYHHLGHYGIIGNLETVALVGANGSIDWCCLPHMESRSVFAKILDAGKGGSFSIAPKLPFKGIQNYKGDTNVLETRFTCRTGEAVLTDFMPPFKKRTKWHKHQILFRKVECTKGFVACGLTFKPRFDYARVKPQIEGTDTGIVAIAGEEKLFLDMPAVFYVKDHTASASFTLSKGESAWATMQYNAHENFNPKNRESELRNTLSFWKNWAHKCERSKCIFRGDWHDLAVRSGLVLKLLTHGETGAIAAAATTSLPESIGGERNWDYRFNWMRDSVFTAQALFNLGHEQDAKNLLNWFKKIYKGVEVSDIRIMQSLHGEDVPPEQTLRHLEGYRKSRPVRIDNSATGQKQFDIYGELLSMAYETTRFGETISKNDWNFLKKTADFVCEIWRTKDAGIWEVRGHDRHFVFSKVMCWVALDRAIKIAVKKNFPAPLQKWEENRDAIWQMVLKEGFNKKMNTFVQSFGSQYLDAANLLIPIVGFLPGNDYRVVGTIEATMKYLTKKGLVQRYNGPDGVRGKEGSFVMCAFWLIDALALAGRVAEAEKLYRNILAHASPLGLFAEEIDAETGMQLGNYPQAFSHTALINSALYLGIAKGKQPPTKVTPLGFLTNGLFQRFKIDITGTGRRVKEAWRFLSNS